MTLGSFPYTREALSCGAEGSFGSLVFSRGAFSSFLVILSFLQTSVVLSLFYLESSLLLSGRSLTSPGSPLLRLHN